VDLAFSGLHPKFTLVSPPPGSCRQKKMAVFFVKMGCQLFNIDNLNLVRVTGRLRKK
jgi:hypothetical protein